MQHLMQACASTSQVSLLVQCIQNLKRMLQHSHSQLTLKESLPTSPIQWENQVQTTTSIHKVIRKLRVCHKMRYHTLEPPTTLRMCTMALQACIKSQRDLCLTTFSHKGVETCQHLTVTSLKTVISREYSQQPLTSRPNFQMIDLIL